MISCRQHNEAAGVCLTRLHVCPRLPVSCKDLHFSSPSSSAPEYGPDGKQKGFSNRKFAADYSENPVGEANPPSTTARHLFGHVHPGRQRRACSQARCRPQGTC